MDKLDHDRLVELWTARLRAQHDYDRGYQAGRFTEYVAQNAIGREDIIAAQRDAYAQVFDVAPTDVPPFAGTC